ncbi:MULTISPECIES: dihydroneopterin aldolase [Mesorhizobium]|nr:MULTISPECIES: dihydroneopterin aldolase [Mesorhizobium]
MPAIRKTIIVRDLELLLSIGVHDHEKTAPQRLLISVEATLDGSKDEGDLLGGTLDYDTIRHFAKQLEHGAHHELQETIARRILDFVLSNPEVMHVVVETAKPDIFDDCAFVGVRLEGDR